MTRKEALEELIAKVEAGEAVEVCEILGKMVVADTPWDFASQVISAHRGSLDAAKALHEAVLPGWSYVVTSNGVYLWRNEDFDDPFCAPYAAKGDNPARAWLLAILRALLAQEPSE